MEKELKMTKEYSLADKMFRKKGFEKREDDDHIYYKRMIFHQSKVLPNIVPSEDIYEEIRFNKNREVFSYQCLYLEFTNCFNKTKQNINLNE